MTVLPGTRVGLVKAGADRPAATYAWASAVRKSAKSDAFTAEPALNEGFVHENAPRPTLTRRASMRERSSVKWTALMTVARRPVTDRP